MKPEIEKALVEMARLWKLVGPQCSTEKALDALGEAMLRGQINPPNRNVWGIEYCCGPQAAWKDGEWHQRLRVIAGLDRTDRVG